MPRNHFALESPRKISIAIPGYDGSALLKAQSQRRAENKVRQEKARLVAREKRVAAAITRAIVDDATAVAELELLNMQSHASVGTDVLRDLMVAFELPVSPVASKPEGA